LSTVFRAGKNARLRARCAPAGLTLGLVVTMLAGCANSKRPTVGPIEFVDATGAPISAVTTLAINQPVYMIATVSNDNDFLGVTWAVTCGAVGTGGSGGITTNTACGVASPSQTVSGPIPTYPSTGIITTYTAPSVIPKGGTATIYAHATSLPSAFSSVTFTIVDKQAASQR